MVRAIPNDSALHWWRKNPLSVNIIAPSMSVRNIRNVGRFAKVRGQSSFNKARSTCDSQRAITGTLLGKHRNFQGIEIFCFSKCEEKFPGRWGLVSAYNSNINRKKDLKSVNTT